MLSTANEAAVRDVVGLAESIVATLKGVLPADDSEADEDQDETSGAEPSSETKSSSDVTTPSPSVCLALTEIKIQQALLGG